MCPLHPPQPLPSSLSLSLPTASHVAPILHQSIPLTAHADWRLATMLLLKKYMYSMPSKLGSA